MSAPARPDASLLAFYDRHHLGPPGAEAQWVPLTGGVSSDIWRVDAAGRSICIKRALAKLKVAADWEAPLSRNVAEWNWLQFAAACAPQAVPQPLAHDAELGMFAMAYLPQQRFALWKQELLAGRVDLEAARSVGTVMGRLHAAAARDASLPARFDTGASFHALRLDPYLLEVGRRHPALQGRLSDLVQRTFSTRCSLVHGDISPKNILLSEAGPVFLDAECAWFGDPAFDLAFCLNHLLLKGVVRPDCRAPLLAAFDALRHAYLGWVDWEPVAALEERAAQLLPALLLARVDGKSPVEYIRAEADREAVRRFAIPRIAEPPRALAPLRDAWARVG